MRKPSILLKRQKKQQAELDRTFFSELLKNFLFILNSIPEIGEVSVHHLRYCERFLEFLIDLEGQLPTRRFFNTLLDDHNIVLFCRTSALAKRKDASLFRDLLDNLTFYANFEIKDQTGEPLSRMEMDKKHADELLQLQTIAFQHYQPTLQRFALSHIGGIETKASLAEHFSLLSDEQLAAFCTHLNLRNEGIDSVKYSREFIIEILVSRFEKKTSQLDAINNMPLYPDELILWDDAVVKTEYYSGEHCLALPKLNLQFLTIHDYLLRNFNLFRLESNFEIRSDLEDAIKRMAPRFSVDGSTDFQGWARMGVPILDFNVVEIGRSKLGETKPSYVKADVTYNLERFTESIRQEWEALREHDVLFLLTIRATPKTNQPYHDEEGSSFRDHFGVLSVRGCEVTAIIGPDGKPLDDFALSKQETKPQYKNQKRTLRVLLDTSQYQKDILATQHGAEDIYSTFNVLIRRKPQENNFKAVLETIRDLMQADCTVPNWLHDIFLGYGDAGAAHYSKMPNQLTTIDFNDTFINSDHLLESFPPHKILISDGDLSRIPPSKVSFIKSEAEGLQIKATTYSQPNRGPYPFNQPKKNQIKFTSTQVEAIKSGINPGLTLIVGPPGTGKTDVAVQIVSNLYHNFPEQHTLLITHSNQGLNQIFEKIVQLDIDERHCLRLGHGVEEVETEKDFSKYGRVDSFLSKRIELLAEVDRLAKSLNIAGDHGYTCETAGHFFLYHIVSRWEKFQETLSRIQKPTGDDLVREFPFHEYFSNAPQPLFPANLSYEEAQEIADGCYNGHLRNMFTQLEEMRAFELLRSAYDRSNYLLTKEAKIIAMTCTHAALKRRELVSLAFKYDNVVMEEAGQILEVETFIPFLLQKNEDGVSRLKRVICIGDHNQLPPVVKNMAFQRYGNMEQSLFTRFVRLGVPTIDLDAQGRARSSIAALYSWKYKNLGNLPAVQKGEYELANPGFNYDYQVIDVQDFQGQGESEPTAHYYQNLGEAEYVVAVYQYMRLIGYPAEKISILTTYNGQKDLIRDVINQRCAWNPLFGRPHKIATVDKFQGQQNDYILLSLVRTKSVGHIRDVRRLIVAMSRARLGMYIFCRKSLFENCYELTPAFKLLLQRPTKLHLHMGEVYPGTRKVSDIGTSREFHDVIEMGQFVYQMSQEQTKRLQVLYQQEQEETRKKEKEEREKNEKEKALLQTEKDRIKEERLMEKARKKLEKKEKQKKERGETDEIMEDATIDTNNGNNENNDNDDGENDSEDDK